MIPGFSLAVTIALRDARGPEWLSYSCCLPCPRRGGYRWGWESQRRYYRGYREGCPQVVRRGCRISVAASSGHRPAAAYLTKSAVVSEVVEMRAMAQVDSKVNPGAESKRRRTLVELKAVDDLYPLVGRLDCSLAPHEGNLAREGGVGALWRSGIC